MQVPFSVIILTFEVYSTCNNNFRILLRYVSFLFFRTKQWLVHFPTQYHFSFILFHSETQKRKIKSDKVPTIETLKRIPIISGILYPLEVAINIAFKTHPKHVSCAILGPARPDWAAGCIMLGACESRSEISCPKQAGTQSYWFRWWLPLYAPSPLRARPQCGNARYQVVRRDYLRHRYVVWNICKQTVHSFKLLTLFCDLTFSFGDIWGRNPVFYFQRGCGYRVIPRLHFIGYLYKAVYLQAKTGVTLLT